MEVMLSGRSLYGASCLPSGTGELVSHLPPQGNPGSRPWAPLRPTRRGIQANGCCWRRGPLSLAEDGARPLKLVSLPGRLTRGRGEEDGSVGPGRPGPPARVTAHGEGWCPTRGAPTTEEAEGGSPHGAGPDTEVGGGLLDGADSTTKIEGGSCRGAGPLEEVDNGLHGGADPPTEVDGGFCHGVSPLEEVEGGSCHRADSLSEAGHGLNPGPVAQSGRSHRAGFSLEANGAGQIEEKEHGPHDRGGPRVETGAEPYHGASTVSECYQRAELNCEPHHRAGRRGSSQDNEDYVGKDGTSTGLTGLQEQQFMLRGIEDGDEQATETACLSETHPYTAHKHCSPASGSGPRPTGLFTMTTAGKDGQAPGAIPQQSGEPEEADDDFGTFEKAGNLVLWAEPVGPIWLEDERLFGQCGNTAAKSQEADKDTDHHRSWGPWPKNLRETAQHPASLHGSLDGAVESWESRSPHPSPSLTSRGSWVAFDGASQGGGFDAFPEGERAMGQRGAGEQWWSPRPPVAAASEPSPARGYLQSVLRSCFPAVPSASSSQVAFPTLERVLSGAEERGGEELSSGQARELWALLQDMDEAVGLKHRRAGCQSHRLLLASLQVDPANTDPPAGQTAAPGSSPQFSRERRAELHPSAVAVAPDSRELMLIKNSFPQHQTNGFSPSHRIQAFFYHWAQTDRSGRCKTPYDVNKNFMA
ncbi:uncharacterized protein si:ch211-14c7.2 [Mobula hypostoma]|uniref:uncharacterized protein si:ch211-14c7.2 n=1 Tax=Mobula hypostoma TaxID=723540 RepID=UPI002FC391EC